MSNEQIWDPEHDWILQFERLLKPTKVTNDFAKFEEGTVFMPELSSAHRHLYLSFVFCFHFNQNEIKEALSERPSEISEC